MQETKYDDGRVKQEFITAKSAEAMRRALTVMHQTALADPRVTEIRQVKVGRNAECPCGSGLKFKKCCLSKAREVE